MSANEKVKIFDDRVVIGPIIARWPNLTTKNTQFGEGPDARYTVAIQLDREDADLLSEHMRSIHDQYVAKHPKSAEMQVAAFGKDLGNGRVQFELQNRERPDVVDAAGWPYDECVRDRSTVRVVVEPVTYTDNRANRTGVSLRLKTLVLEREPPSDLDLLGLSFDEAASDGWQGEIEEWPMAEPEAPRSTVE